MRQSNNAVVIESPGLAADYEQYWKELKADTEQANGVSSELQAVDPFRNDNMENERTRHDLLDADQKPAGQVHVWFSPNTKRKTKGAKTPPDLEEVFDLIDQAKQGALFLAFIPGKPSIVTKLKEVYDAKRKEGKLFFLRGAATSPDPAGEFRVDLYHRSSRSDASVRGAPIDGAPAKLPSANVASVAGIYAAFAHWEAEIYKVGHAVIHDKIVVIDPFTDDSVVITGSHNLGFKASYCNDENLLVIEKNREVAEAYAAHVLDVYEHYRWRWRIQQPLRDAFAKMRKVDPDADSKDLWKEVYDKLGEKVLAKTWHSLNPRDAWQDFYQEHKDFLAAEVNFWSPFGGESLASGKPRDPASGPRPPRRRRP